MESLHVKGKVPANKLCDQSTVQIEGRVVTAKQNHTQTRNGYVNPLFIDDLIVSVLFGSLFFKADKLLAIRVIPDAELELRLILILVAEIEVIALHQVSEHFLHHGHPYRFTLDSNVLCVVKICEVDVRSQEHPLIEHR